MVFTIEKDKSIVAAKTGIRQRFPFTEMEIGDSFLIPDGIFKDKAIAQRSAIHEARYAGYREGILLRIKTRQVDDGVRVWRVK